MVVLRESEAYRVVYEVGGEELVISGLTSLREASEEAWHLRRLGFVAWAEERGS